MKLTLPWLRILWITFVLALPAVILYSLFTRVVKCPACYLFEDGGDGLKNYYTLDYYVKHDDGWHFTGMNYPYGENRHAQHADATIHLSGDHNHLPPAQAVDDRSMVGIWCRTLYHISLPTIMALTWALWIGVCMLSSLVPAPS